MTNDTKLSPEEYQIIIEKIKEGTATEEEKALVENLINKAMEEVEKILDENAN